MIKRYKGIKMLSAVKKLFYCGILFLFLTSFHPYYVSVTEIKYKEEEKILQISCRTFTDNIESALKKIYKKPIDLLHPKDKVVVEKFLAHYICSHLKITADAKLLELNFIGYEKEEEAIWTYLEVKNTVLPEVLVIENTLLYEYHPQQINMVHIEIKGEKKSLKVTNPEKLMTFNF